VQKETIPRLLKGENVVMAASTGSGKTLAYTLPIMQHLHEEENNQGYERLPKRPRCLILVPTRELAKQVLDQIKGLSHIYKVSSTAVMGGEDYGIQRKGVRILFSHCECFYLFKSFFVFAFSIA
jgi:ATP-dependent RNA helicase RhlE